MNPVATAPAARRVVLRPLAPADVPALCDLFQRHAAYRRDAAFWQWLNRLVPAQPSLAAVAEVDGALAAHYAILPVDLRLPDGSVARAGHGVHAFVSPAHRGDVSIFQVSALAYRLAQAAGLRFVYGFPNAHYRAVQEKVERWRRVALFPAWTRRPAPSDCRPAPLVPADLADDAELHAALALWEAADAAPGPVRPAGLTRWWQARYGAHPQRPYSWHWLLDGGRRVGLAVAKVFRTEGETRAHLVDFVLAADAAPAALLAAFAATFADRADRFVHWPADPACTAALVEEGYHPDGFETWLGVRALGPEPLPAAVLEPGAWRLVPGLSDAF